jgi:hypothetical protein
MCVTSVPEPTVRVDVRYFATAHFTQSQITSAETLVIWNRQLSLTMSMKVDGFGRKLPGEAPAARGDCDGEDRKLLS